MVLYALYTKYLSMHYVPHLATQVSFHILFLKAFYCRKFQSYANIEDYFNKPSVPSPSFHNYQSSNQF